MSMDDVLHAEAAGDLRSAAALYEAAIKSGNCSVDAHINLAVLYWQCSEYGFWTSMKLPREFAAQAASRVGPVIEEALLLFPEQAGPQFWKRYIAWLDLGEDFPLEDCRLLMTEGNFAEASVYLFPATAGKEAVEEARTTLSSCHGGLTTRCRYVASVLSAAFQQMNE